MTVINGRARETEREAKAREGQKGVKGAEPAGLDPRGTSARVYFRSERVFSLGLPWAPLKEVFSQIKDQRKKEKGMREER